MSTTTIIRNELGTETVTNQRRRVQLDLRGLVLPTFLLMTWTVIGFFQLVNPLKLPPPWVVAETAWELLVSGDFWLGLSYSLGRVMIGFTIAALIGTAIGVLLGISRWADRLATPSFNAFRQIAPFAWIPLISAWTGAGESTKLTFIVVASLAPIAISTFDGVRAVTKEHLELARVLDIRGWRFIRSIVIPSASPHLFTGIKLSLISAWLATIGAEFFLQVAPGVTFILQTGRASLRMELVIVAVVLIGLIGFSFSYLVSTLERRVLRWRPRVPHH